MLSKFSITIFINRNKIKDWEVKYILEVTPECLPVQLSNHSKHREKVSSSNSDCIIYTWTFMNEKHYNCEMVLSNKPIYKTSTDSR